MTARFALRAAGWLAPLALVATVVAAPAPARAADKPEPADQVFAPGKLWPVHITLSAEEYAAIQPRPPRGFPGFGPPPKKGDKKDEKPADPARELHRNTFGTDLPWGVGAVTIGARTFDKVGIRYKGNGTIGDATRTAKKSIKIDLDRAGGTGRFAGSKTVNLHCEVTDPSKCREALGYAVYRAAGVPAPRTAFAEVRLTVPGKFDKELLGVYALVEEVDRPFLRDRFGDDGGLLMKPENLREFEDRGDAWDKYKPQYLPKREPTKDEAARVVAFARLVHKADDATFRKEIGAHLDVDNYLRFLAATAFVANVDSFFALGHNYCLYLHPTTSKLHFLPWDLDRAFANFPIFGSRGQQMDLSLARPYAGPHRLTDRLLADPEVAARYQKLLKELAGTAFAKDRLLDQLAAAEAVVKDPLEREQKAAAARKDNPGPNMFGTPPKLRTFIERRSASVAAQLAGASKGFVPVPFGGPPKFGALLAPPMLEAMDEDGDEYVSRDEWLGSAKRVFAACEKDADGKVDRKALAAGVRKSLPPPHDGAPGAGFNLGEFLADAVMARADADKDGKLTADELQTAAKAAFDEFDRRKAGKLDEDGFADLLTAVFPAPQFGPPPPPPKDKK